MQVAVLTFDAFNELDSFIVSSLLGRLAHRGVQAWITSPSARITSKGGVVVEAQRPLAFANQADAVVIGSGKGSDRIAVDPAILGALDLQPSRQLIVSQCSGALLLHGLGLVPAGQPVCTDLSTVPYVEALGLKALDRPFHADGNVASAGGCLGAQYIAAWLVARRLGFDAAQEMIWGAAPVGEKDEYTERILAGVRPFVPVLETADAS